MPCRSLLRALLVVSLLLVAGLGPTAPAQGANSGFVSRVSVKRGACHATTETSEGPVHRLLGGAGRFRATYIF